MRICIEAHGCPIVQVVLRPTGVATGSETHPGGVHRISRLLWWIVSQQRSHFSDVECVEDERNLQPVTRAEASLELRRSPGKLVHIRAPVVPRVGLGQANGGDAEEPAGDNGLE